MAARSRPAIKPWLPTVWRAPDTLQIGVDPTVGVLVSGLDALAAAWMTSLDGSRSEAQLLAEAPAFGLDLATAVRILSGLRQAGVLLSAPIGTEVITDRGPLVPELVDLIGTAPGAVHGSAKLAERAGRHVVIDGANRIGVPLGAVLAASGVGRLSFLDSDSVRRCDAAVGGLGLGDEGQPRIVAAQQAILRVAATSGTPAEGGPPDPDLIVLCQPWAAHDPLHAQDPVGHAAHLPVAVREGSVTIGPLVLPGRTSCLHCAELHRTDRDPGWPAVAAQLLADPSRAVHQPTSVLATLAAALAAGQILEYLDGVRLPEVIEATLELRPPDWRLHRRRWPAHPDCGCLQAVQHPARAC